MSYSAQKMPSLPITSSLHLHLSTPAGSWCWEATCFPCIWSWGNGETMSPFCDILPTSLPIVALLLHSQSPSLTSQGGDSHPSATQKAQLQFPTVISMWYLQITQPLDKCPSPYTVGPSHTPKHPEELLQSVQNFTTT